MNAACLVILVWMTGLICGTILILHDHVFVGVLIAMLGLVPSVNARRKENAEP